MSSISELSRFFDIFKGEYEQINGRFIAECYYSWESWTTELLPQPKRFPASSKARLWFAPATIFLIFGKFFYIN